MSRIAAAVGGFTVVGAIYFVSTANYHSADVAVAPGKTRLASVNGAKSGSIYAAGCG